MKTFEEFSTYYQNAVQIFTKLHEVVCHHQYLWATKSGASNAFRIYLPTVTKRAGFASPFNLVLGADEYSDFNDLCVQYNLRLEIYHEDLRLTSFNIDPSVTHTQPVSRANIRCCSQNLSDTTERRVYFSMDQMGGGLETSWGMLDLKTTWANLIEIEQESQLTKLNYDDLIKDYQNMFKHCLRNIVGEPHAAEKLVSIGRYAILGHMVYTGAIGEYEGGDAIITEVLPGPKGKAAFLIERISDHQQHVIFNQEIVTLRN